MQVSLRVAVTDSNANLGPLKILNFSLVFLSWRNAAAAPRKLRSDLKKHSGSYPPA
jgi:hypothetical protein